MTTEVDLGQRVGMADPTDTTTVLDPTAPAPSAPPSASPSASPSTPVPRSTTSSSTQVPSLGRVVHYAHPHVHYSADGSPSEMEIRPHSATISRVNDDGSVNLAIDDDGISNAGGVVLGVYQGEGPGEWKWPARV